MLVRNSASRWVKGREKIGLRWVKGRENPQGSRFAASVALAVVIAAGVTMSAAQAATVYVSNVDGDSVAAIDPQTHTVIEIPVGNEPRNLAANPAGTWVYVPNRFGGNVSVIDTSTNTVVTTVEHNDFDEPYAVAVTPDGSEAWVANKQGGAAPQEASPSSTPPRIPFPKRFSTTASVPPKGSR